MRLALLLVVSLALLGTVAGHRHRRKGGNNDRCTVRASTFPREVRRRHFDKYQGLASELVVHMMVRKKKVYHLLGIEKVQWLNGAVIKMSVRCAKSTCKQLPRGPFDFMKCRPDYRLFRDSLGARSVAETVPITPHGKCCGIMTVTWLLFLSLAALAGHGSSGEETDAAGLKVPTKGSSHDDYFPKLRSVALMLAQRLSMKRRFLLYVLQITSAHVKLTDQGYLIWISLNVLDSSCPMRHPYPHQHQCHMMVCQRPWPCYGWIRDENGKLSFLWQKCHERKNSTAVKGGC